MKEARIGCRIECDGAKGTLKWVGEIPSFTSLWYGVEWDDEKRGKHDGSHQGIQYFETRGATSGSFVRPSKVNLGMTLEEAVRGRYQDDVNVAEELTSQFKRNINARFVEVVGMDKIGKRQSDLSHLQTAVLDGWPVAFADDGDSGDNTDSRDNGHTRNNMDSGNNRDSLDSGHSIDSAHNRDNMDSGNNIVSLESGHNKASLDTVPTPGVPLGSLLPSLRDLDVSNSLLSSWTQVAAITGQLPTLTFLNVSGNPLTLPGDPNDLVGSTGHVTHVIMTRMPKYTWDDLVTCSAMFPRVKKMQLAFNSLEILGPIPTGVFEHLKDVDLGANPISDWSQVCHLGGLPNLEILNMNSCRLTVPSFPETPSGAKTPLFPRLSSLMLAGNPLYYWDSVGELDKLSSLSELVLNHEEMIGRGNYFMEFTFARIRSLKMLNRTRVTSREKKDFDLFYLRTFSEEYYAAGGVADLGEGEPPRLTKEFLDRHPGYVELARALGSPLDERNHSSQKSQRLKDLKVELVLHPEREPPQERELVPVTKSFLPATRISKLKMMIRRIFGIKGGEAVKLFYCPLEDKPEFEICLDNDVVELQLYSVKSGNVLKVRW